MRSQQTRVLKIAKPRNEILIQAKTKDSGEN